MLSVTRAIEYGLEMFAHGFKLISTDVEGVVHAGWVKSCTTMDRFAQILDPNYVHPSWFVIFALITFSLATQFTPQRPRWSHAQHWSLGI